MSTLWSPSRVEMRTAWLEEHGIGACSGREYRLARERRPRENIPPSPTGTHTTAASMLTLIPVLFVSPSPIPSPHLSSPPLCLALSWSLTPHPMSSCFYRHCCPHLPVFISFRVHPPPPPCILYAWPQPHSVRTVCTVPLIDSIHGQKYTIEPQGGGDEDGFARGAWDWSMLWKRVPLGDKEKQSRKTRTEPYRYRKPMPPD